MLKLFKFKYNIRALLEFTIFFACFFLFRIYYTFDFLNPYIIKKIREYINRIIDTKPFLEYKNDIILNKEKNNLERKSSEIKKKNLQIRKNLFRMYYLFLGVLITLNVVLFFYDKDYYLRKIKLDKYLLIRIVLNLLFYATIIFSFTITATVPYYKSILLKNLHFYYKDFDNKIFNK